MEAQRTVGLAWAVAFGFIRLVTSPAVLGRPLAPKDALVRVREGMLRDNVYVVEPGGRHLDVLAELFEVTGVAGTLTTDTHLAALAIEHNAELPPTTPTSGGFPACPHAIRSRADRQGRSLRDRRTAGARRHGGRISAIARSLHERSRPQRAWADEREHSRLTRSASAPPPRAAASPLPPCPP